MRSPEDFLFSFNVIKLNILQPWLLVFRYVFSLFLANEHLGGMESLPVEQECLRGAAHLGWVQLHPLAGKDTS